MFRSTGLAWTVSWSPSLSGVKTGKFAGESGVHLPVIVVTERGDGVVHAGGMCGGQKLRLVGLGIRESLGCLVKSVTRLDDLKERPPMRLLVLLALDMGRRRLAGDLAVILE